jgi:hypothetical protein
MTSSVLAMLPSPFLGAAAWESTAEALTRAGTDVLVCTTPPSPREAEHVLAHLLRQLPEHKPVRLVAHSNAGLYVPGIQARHQVDATVFVDAALPPAGGRTVMTPPSLRKMLDPLGSEDGWLPAWTRWWEEDAVAALFPDPVTRARIEAAQPRAAATYPGSSLETPAGWQSHPHGYLAFGDTYAEELATATSWGWPTRTLPGGHLHMLQAPAAVAEALLSLLRVLDEDPRRSD